MSIINWKELWQKESPEMDYANYLEAKLDSLWAERKFAQELGKRGGQTTLKKHGKKHFSSAGKKGNEVRWKNKTG